MTEDQFKVLCQKLDNLQKTCNRIFKDEEDIFKEEQRFTLRLGALEQSIDNLEKRQSNMVGKVQDSVADAVEPVISEAQELKEEIKNKRTIVLSPSLSLPQKIKSLFRKGGV